MVVLFPYSEGKRKSVRTGIDNFNDIKKYYQSEMYETKGILDYPRFIEKYWRKAEIIIVEHDIMASKEMIDDLMFCKETNCTYPYILDYKNPVLSVFKLTYNTVAKGYAPSSYSKGDFPEYADFSGIGLCKIGVKTQYAFEWRYEDKYKDWGYVDQYISFKMADNNLRWHCHYPLVEHLHF